MKDADKTLLSKQTYRILLANMTARILSGAWHIDHKLAAGSAMRTAKEVLDQCNIVCRENEK